MGLVGIGAYTYTQSNSSDQNANALHDILPRMERADIYEGSGDIFEGSGQSSHPGEFWLNLIESGDTYMSGVLSNELSSLKKTGSVIASKKERNRQNRIERKQRKKNRPEKFLSLSRKSLQRAEQRLKEIWTDQAKDWVSINERSWEFESFQSKEVVDDLAMLPDEHVGHVGHADIAPAVAELLQVGQCENWDGSERPINLFFGVQNTVPLHAKNKRSDFGYLMQFVADLITSIDTRGNKAKIFAYNDVEQIEKPNFIVQGGNGRKNWKSRQNKQIRRSISSKPTLARPKIKPIIEHLNNEMNEDSTSIMSGRTNIVFLFITNIPEDLDSIDEGYLEKEINELNQKAFVIVIFVHPMADDELRTIPYRIVPKQWTHGLRDNEFAQRILVRQFSDLASNRNNPMIESIKNLLCVVDERIQCRLANRPWHEASRSLQMRSSPQIDSCCGHEISSKAYDSRFKTCCRDGTVKSWLSNGQNPCGASNSL